MISNDDHDTISSNEPLQQQIVDCIKVDEEGVGVETQAEASESCLQPHQQPLSKEEMIKMLSERYVLNLTPEQDELLDPIERTVRYIIPIPKYYYWDVLKSKQQQQQQQQQKQAPEERSNRDDATTDPATVDIDAVSTNDIPYSIKSWHNIIYICDTIGTWTNNHIAQPLASSIGLTGPRFHEVIDSMSPTELNQSIRYVNERKQNDITHRQV